MDSKKKANVSNLLKCLWHSHLNFKKPQNGCICQNGKMVFLTFYMQLLQSKPSVIIASQDCPSLCKNWGSKSLKQQNLQK